MEGKGREGVGGGGVLKAASVNVLQQNIFNFNFSFLFFPHHVLLFSFFLKCVLRWAETEKKKSLKTITRKTLALRAEGGPLGRSWMSASPAAEEGSIQAGRHSAKQHLQNKPQKDLCINLCSNLSIHLSFQPGNSGCTALALL